jgi:hypothetical protein
MTAAILPLPQTPETSSSPAGVAGEPSARTAHTAPGTAEPGGRTTVQTRQHATAVRDRRLVHVHVWPSPTMAQRHGGMPIGRSHDTVARCLSDAATARDADAVAPRYRTAEAVSNRWATSGLLARGERDVVRAGRSPAAPVPGQTAAVRSCVGMFVFVCTRDDRLVRLRRDGRSWTAEPGLEGVGARCVAAAGACVFVGTRGRGAFLSADAGVTWEHAELPERDVFAVAIGAADGALYAGAEPSRLFVARDRRRWAELEALQQIPSRAHWSFPPRPWTHHVRWIAPDPHDAERLLVGIELGGVMYSEDGGATFSDHRPGAKLDAHSLVWHPRVQGRAYQSAGDGAAWSRDGGRTWQAADAGRELGYCWALAVDPADPERWYVSAASGPRAAHAGAGARGRLYRWQGSWEALALPFESMPYALAATDDELLAGMADGRILNSRDRGESWGQISARVGSITAMAAAE